MKKKYEKHFDAIFIQRDTWIFIGAGILLSLVLTNMNRPYSWGEYIGYLTIIACGYFPTLLFSWNKKFFRDAFRLRYFLLCWLGAHVVYPMILAASFEFYQPRFIPIDRWDALFIVGGVGQFFIAFALEINAFLGKRIPRLSWLQKIGLEKGIWIIISMLSIFIGFIAVVDLNVFVPMDDGILAGPINFIFYILHFLRFTGQILFAFGSLYFFYYVNHYVLIPKFLKQRGILIYAASIIGTVVFFYPVLAQIIAWFPLNVYDWRLLPSENLVAFDEINGLVPFFLMLFSIPLIIAIQWYRQDNQIVNLEKQQTTTELSLLKQQVNPHFFFNTLNNLYALSLKKSEQTPEVIMQLADLMRYVIYKGKESQVPISGEVQYLEDYIQLQQIRLHKTLDLRFTKDIEDEDLLLPPLLFIILVENAFKHGIEPAENPAYLYMDMFQHGNQITFTCENSVEEENHKKPGIGLENLHRRLELLFPENHQLKVEKRNGSFWVELTITLEETAEQKSDRGDDWGDMIVASQF